MKLIAGYGVCGFLGILSFVLLWMVWTGKIDLDALVSEVNGQASVSRFQLVIFTIVIALGLFILTIQDGKFPEISAQILILLGISSTTYAVGKGISYSQPGVLNAAGDQKTVKDISATGAAAIATPDGVAAEGAPNPVAAPAAGLGE
ncbi:hypothetical protein [Granulicella tundricola]|uniref:hypothetical protein n=1 Tax=Granulicella tundricola TaxID=940615 RepID=UPI0012F7EE99|nr:hypothetical protein [Granulicella tundricola]